MNSKIINKDYDGLTQRDLNNLKFLKNAPNNIIEDWILCVSKDDILYALDLMTMHNLRLCDEASENSNLTETKTELAKIGIFVTNTEI
jgi:hypothetical protein